MRRPDAVTTPLYVPRFGIRRGRLMVKRGWRICRRGNVEGKSTYVGIR